MNAYKTGNYRNVFAEIGKSNEAIEARLREAWETFFCDAEEHIYHEAGDDMGYLEDTGNHDARTEGMSYGMMMCVQLDRKEEFDRIWKWAKTYMYMDQGENEGYFAWSCKTDGTKNAYGPAPDGEEFFAMALFFASHRWGDGEGIFEYSREAKDILRACLHKGENGRAGHPMWNRENGQILFVPGSPFTDPSYHLPHFYELFGEWAYEEDRAFFKRAAKVSREYLAKACHQETGLNSEYANFDGTPMDKQLPWGNFGTFFSDAYRTAANIGLDAEWFGEDAGQLAVPLRMMKFFGTDLEAVRCSYTVDGKPLDRPVLHPLGLLSTIAQSALAVPYSDDPDSDFTVAKQWVEWFWSQPMRRGGRRYYDNCLYMFALLALCGLYRVW
ncbi:MAG: xylanase [Lachnospiraceae bacterium]|nr:xylanase [Lachnospiraceae bacterium]